MRRTYRKRLFAALSAVILLFSICGCRAENTAEKTYLQIPFGADDVAYAEMFHHGILRGEPVSVEKKIVTSAEDIRAMTEGLQKIELRPVEKIRDTYSSVYAFRFYPSEAEKDPFEITYYAYGVKDGAIRLQGEESGFAVISDAGWYWWQLNQDLIAVHAEESELPK